MTGNKAEKVALDVLSHFFQEMQEKTRVVEEEEEGEDLCNCEFSLAYGMLLHLFVCGLLTPCCRDIRLSQHALWATCWLQSTDCFLHLIKAFLFGYDIR